MRTCGRHPTFGEVCDYYSRSDVLEFLQATCRTRRVCVVVPVRKHWEPDWNGNRVPADTDIDGLRRFVLGKIHESLPDLAPDDRPPFYPSLHQTVDHWAPGETDRGAPRGCDGVCEADLPNWRLAFTDVHTLLSVLRDEGIPHRCKFSGHRSLHVVVPFANGHIRAAPFGDSVAHGVRILRMPYSLNEDTGLVSLPLDPDALPVFRPWQANLHVVELAQDWLEPDTEADRATVTAFLKRHGGREPVPRRPCPSCLEALDGVRQCAVTCRVSTPAGSEEDVVARQWRRLTDGGADAVSLRQAIGDGGADALWLAAEGFLLHGHELPDDLIPDLLASDDVYVRPAALDIMARFPEQSLAFFKTMIQEEDLSLQSRALIVLAHQEELRRDVVESLRTTVTSTGTLETRLACVTGVVLHNWDGARALVDSARARGAGGPNWDVRVEALTHLEAMCKCPWDPGSIPMGFRIGQLGPAVTDLVLLALGSDNRFVQLACLVALSEIADPRGLDVLLANLANKYRDSARWSTRGLMRIGEPAVPALLDAAASDEARLRRYAVRCLGHMADPRARDTLLGALEDADDTVCRQAVMALRNLPDADDLGPLAKVLGERDWRTAREAAASISDFGRDGRELLQHLAETGLLAAAAWLWEHGDRAVRPQLVDALSQPGRNRDCAIMALVTQPLDDELIERLLACLRDENQPEWDRNALVQALAHSRSPQVFNAMAQLLKSSDSGERRDGLEALQGWNTPEADAILVDAIGDRKSRLREAAIAALWPRLDRAMPLLQQARQQDIHSRNREAIDSVLAGHAALTRLTEGELFSKRLLKGLRRCFHHAVPRAALILRERNNPDELEAVAALLLEKRHVFHWCAQHLIGLIGAPARAAARRVVAGAPDGEPRRQAEALLEELEARALNTVPSPDDD